MDEFTLEGHIDILFSELSNELDKIKFMIDYLDQDPSVCKDIDQEMDEFWNKNDDEEEDSMLDGKEVLFPEFEETQSQDLGDIYGEEYDEEYGEEYDEVQ